VKFGITARLAVVLALIGMAVSGLTGFYAYSVSRDLLIQSAQGELMTSTQVVARRISQTRQELSRNLMLLAAQPEALVALKAQCARSSSSARLALEFRELMRVNPSYFQLRLISAAEGGPECVRVDRDANALLEISGDDLQEKGHFMYVTEALKLKPGQTYLSQITINHERGAHAGQEKPTVILSTPVVDAQGKAVGVIVINVDLNGMFSLLAADLPGDHRLYLSNHRGDFLIHPDSTRTFGFDRGQRVLLQDEFPQTVDVVAGKEKSVLLETQANAEGTPPLIAAFIASNVVVPGMEERLLLGLAQPRDVVLQQADRLGLGVLQIVLVVSLACVALALLVARAIARPINAMNAAVQKFSNDTQEMALPVDRQDEIGMLARSFARMQTVIRRQMHDLQDNQEELEHLAQHDMLTDLPNRRMLMDRLDNAIARAKRSEVGFALLFVDVDRFKSFNDRYGHAAGDAVLKAVADRLRHGIRAVDTAARLGGDEFVLLLDQFVHRDQIAGFTEKLLALLKAPIDFQGQTLQAEFSIGISQFPDDGSTAEDIVANADRAMYRTKTSGRNGYRFTSDDTTQSSLL
jgi:diguanylate cyclase (GGDEF)-like protein